MKPRPDGNAKALVSGLGVGAALMYFLDPDRGASRRALARDRFAHAMSVAEDAAGTTSRDLANRARGMLAAARGIADSRMEGDDRVIEARVRSDLGRVVSHPGAVAVTADEGLVTLTGDVLSGEGDDLVSRIERIRGVRTVENRLTVHDSAEGVPALQGGVRRGEEFELQENWTPAVRLLSGLAGGVLTMYGVRRRDSFGAAVGLAGLALLARGTTNRELRRVVGTSGGRRAIDIRKTINIVAPVDEVFAFMTDWQNFPRWMTHVREVRVSKPDGRGNVGEITHWEVDGPAGSTITWDAETTRFIRNELVAWKSVEDAPIRQAGRIRFSPTEDGGTRVHIQLSYNPPGGVIGHAVATLFGRDPKHQMDDDVTRLKTTIETGKEPRDTARAERTERGSVATFAEGSPTAETPGA